MYASKYTVIDLNTYQIESTIDDICKCDYILSTSLHGIIVAHAYNIPCIWIKKGYIHTDGIKFNDYFSSVDIPLYNGFEDIDDILKSNSTCMEFFNKNKDFSLPATPLFPIQKRLLATAPFPLKKEFKNIL